MSLSSDLISQFVKLTNDTDKPKKETTTYGTVKKDGDSTYVQLDGAETLTPVVTTVNADDGDRVVVMIKNHTAYVTGNMSYPAARAADVKDYDGVITELGIAVADKVSTSVLDAERARIDSLVAEDVVVKNRLTASEAKIGVLEADNVTIHDTLTANKASIENLETKTADIEVLRADVATIDSLIFGSAGGNVIQTNFANAVIAQLGNAQIKSAMIDSVSASKITAGDIITNNVRVKSQNGLLVISDETIQINDGTRARVQIGKDASNDYSINIWDASGNLMFSKGGITGSAIKDAIIRDDMVSDTANIAAHKLNIDSLFEEINDSTKTIKSTKVYLDDKKQTLDAAFTALSSTVTSQGEVITSQGTAISTIQGQITSKIWLQDINGATGDMSTQYSALSQELSSFKTTVGNTYATKTDLETTNSSITQMSNMLSVNVTETTELGTRMSTVEQTAGDITARLNDIDAVAGRNLLANTAFGPISAHKRYNSSGTLSRTEDGLKITCTSDSSRTGFMLPLATDGILKNGQKYTLSFQYRTNLTETGTLYVLQRTTPNVNVSGGCALTPSENEWQNFKLTFSSNSINDRIGYALLIPYANGINNWIEIRDKTLKLEKGETATEWTSAPEDASLAAKTATDYLNFSTSGLVIGDMTASTLGKNILIDSDSVDIRSGTAVRASFGEDYLYLAKHSRNAKVDLCNGLVTMYHQSKYSYDTLFVIDTPNATEIQGTYNPLCVTSTVSGKVSIQFANSSGVIGSIGMVESGTESYITRNHPSTAATYSILDTGNFYKLMDSGWINCTLNTGSFTRFNNDIPQPQVRKIGKQVYLRGEAKPVTAVTPESDSDTVIATIPSGYRPAQRKQFIMQGSGSYRWMMSIHTDGRIAISRYSNTTTANMNIAAGSWLCCHAQWLID